MDLRGGDSVYYLKNFKEPNLSTIYLRSSETMKDVIGYHLCNIDKKISNRPAIAGSQYP